MFDITDGVTFGSYHTYRDWGLVLESDEIGFPQASGNIDDLPIYGQVDLDPRVTWGRRELRFNFGLAHLRTRWPDLVQTITGAIQGKKLRIIRDKEPDVMYIGRCRVESFATQLSIGHFNIIVDAEPFKTSINPTQYNFSQTQSLTVEYAGDFIAPCKITVTPTAGITTLTINNAARNPFTLEVEPIEVKSLVTNNVLEIDGVEKSVKYNGANKFPDATLWYWPSLVPGINNITFNTTAHNTVIQVYERYI